MNVRLIAILLAASGIAGHAQTREFNHDGILTLRLEVGRARQEGPAAWDVRLSAHLPKDVVDRWARTGRQGLGESDSANPEYGNPRGYRIWFAARRDGVALPPVRTVPGTGPLADRVGVYPSRLGNMTVLTTASSASATFRHQVSTGPAEYEFTWYVDCMVARTEKLTLPPEKPSEESAGNDAPVSTNGRGLIAPGAELGDTYPFTVSASQLGPAFDGEGVIVARLAPEQAQERLALPEAPAQPVLLGWQADLRAGFSILMSAEDQALLPQVGIPVPQNLLPANCAQTTDRPALLVTRQAADSPVRASLGLAPGSLLTALPDGDLFLASGTLRISSLESTVAVITPSGRVHASGLTMVSVGTVPGTRPAPVTLWVARGTAEFRGTEIKQGQVARLSDTNLSISAPEPSELADAFVQTCYATRPEAAPAVPAVSEAASDIIRDVVLCRGLDSRNQPVDPGTVFSAGTPELSLLVSHHLPVREQATLVVTLFRQGNITLRHEVDIMGEGRFVITFRPSAATGFAAGPWKVTIARAGQILRTVDFVIE
ncbi:MAG: hypothetical protein HPY44_00515 [Armatimonadetes bacterium]|nr:hypothetical protein [Armatimonadota bacterium]